MKRYLSFGAGMSNLNGCKQEIAVARTRALLTQNDRKILTGEKGDQNRQRNVEWEVERRIEDELPRDIEILAEEYPDLLTKLRDVVCNEE